jgi:hypothetical protein
MGTDLIFQAVKMSEALACQFAAEVFPDTLGRVEFWTCWGKEDERDVVRDAQTFGGMSPALIHEHDIEGIRMCFRKQVQEHLHVRRIQAGQEEEKALPALRCHRTIEPTVGILVLRLDDRLHPFQGNTAAEDGHQPPAAFVLGPDLQGLGVVGGNGGADPFDDFGFEGFKRIRFFLWLLRRATLGRALSL